MRIVVTGGDGFIGRNLRVRLGESGFDDVVSIDRESRVDELRAALTEADFVFHLAGVNRPEDPSEFDTGNRELTAFVCSTLRDAGRRAPLAITSSTQAALDNPYGLSKRGAEREAERYAADTGALTYVFRLTNVFGKWSRPNYNSAVATFCHNVARGLPIAVNDPAAPLRLVYIDDVAEAMIGLLGERGVPGGEVDVQPVYETTVGDVATMIRDFAESRTTRLIPRVGTGLGRALFATYMSFVPPEAFSYDLTAHTDPRGMFAEVLRTPDSGQLSFFTAGPGVTRGGHYHHTKSERFLVVRGDARFGFRHIVTGKQFEIRTSGSDARVVETVPGWVHDVTNVGEGELVVMLWANENFDPQKPDTIAASMSP